MEANKPYYNCCYPNCICWEFDNIWKMYFDRGIWDMRSCMYKIGCLAGPATFYSNNRKLLKHYVCNLCLNVSFLPSTAKHVCCCMDCCECYNDYVACHCACCCNDRIYYTPCDSFCCGLCSTRATACTNYCGLCGPKTGEPIMAINFIAGLLVGSGESLSIAINNARHTWSARTLKV